MGKPLVKELRENWLARCMKLLRPQFSKAGYPLPENIRASIGFPVGARTTAAQAWHPKCSEDGHYEIFVHPRESDPVEIVAHMEHELAHVALDLKHGHTGPFRIIMQGWGYRGKMTHTAVSKMTPEGRERLERLAKKLGPIPHGALYSDGRAPGAVPGGGGGSESEGDENEGEAPGNTNPRKPGKSRMIRVSCSDCGYIAYTTRKWLDDPGPPHCPSHGAMEEVPASDE